MKRLLRLAAACPLFVAACIPYSVGSTARTVPKGTHEQAVTAFAVPQAASLTGRPGSVAPGADAEVRYGVARDADVGLRIPSWSGAIVSYKHRFDVPPEDAAADTCSTASSIFGAGLLDWGRQGALEVTLVASAREDRPLVPYGGIHRVGVFPLSHMNSEYRAATGGFFGVRIGTRRLSIAPEVGVYHDESEPRVRGANITVVPSVTVRGDALAAFFPR